MALGGVSGNEITTAIAVTVHEVAELLAFANGLRAARA